MNAICPVFIRSMRKKVRTDQAHYISIMKKTVIRPFKMNLVHYFAYTNNSVCLKLALE